MPYELNIMMASKLFMYFVIRFNIMVTLKKAEGNSGKGAVK